MDQTAVISTESQLKSLIMERYGAEPEWMRERRFVAAQGCFTRDWPRLERTPLKKRRLDDMALFEALPPHPGVAQPIDRSNVEIRLENNQVVGLNVPEHLLAAGVILQPLSEALDMPQVRQYLGTVIDDLKDKVTALNGALWQNGVFLSIPDRLSEPVQVSIQSHVGKDVQSFISRNLIVCGRESHVVVTERLSSSETPTKVFLSENTEIIVRDGAKVEYGAIQQCSHNVEGFIHRVGHLAQDAALDWNIGEFGAGLIVSDHVSHLNRPGAHTRSTTVFFGSAQQHQDYTAESYHHAPHTTSDMVARGVMKGRARSVFTGLTQIEAGAKGSDGRQREQTLMLSDESRADAIPSLIIDERDVYAAHAASAGPVDRAAIFYLTSRGLPEAEAVRLIVHGFLAPVIDTIPGAALRDEVWDAVERKIRE